MSEALIQLQGVSYQASLPRRDMIIDNITLAFPSHKIMTIIGPNGAGKTTLLKLLLGFIFPTSGAVFRSKKLNIGYMPQQLALNTLMPLTVERLLQLATPQSNKHLDSLIVQTLTEVGALHLRYQSIHVLSGGERQRVMLARALMSTPNFLVLDEPAQGVDVVGQEELYQLIAKIRDHRHCGIVLVSHDLHTVMRASDEVICLNGHICCSGHPDKVIHHPSYHALFTGKPISEPALTTYTHHHDHCHISLKENNPHD